METNKIKTLEDLEILARKSFVILQPDSRKGHYNITLPVKSYIELHWFILDIVKLSLMALDAEQGSVTTIENPCIAIRGVLEIVLRLVPLEEAELLDKIHEMIRSDDSEQNETTSLKE
ncbi:hypothetical protein [Flavobacterium granuli]|uniref:Uncharacterized protein n=1 Tax=Flavobacterium granuli TaxID=280093 RepID=A0A1M5MGX7_9FLAO|nr:hypothetical protein [Flavobacterium granuli]PRZ24942.1 hypothetical protein BC624_10312 [Flavobacterium granuli]SHG76169.1 hypothetical protein SAMN05443373_10411 [Flavobacterium granuli]